MNNTNSPLISYQRISPNKTVPRNHPIDTLTIHCMAGDLSVETCGGLFASASRKASSNYGIGSDGRIALYVDEKDRSWCSSSKANDHRAVTIEVANDGGAPLWHVSEKAMASLIDLTTDICKRNQIRELIWKGDPSLIGQPARQNMTVHRWFAKKACPGDYLYSKHPYIAEEVNRRLRDHEAGGFEPPTPSCAKTQFIREVQAAIGARTDGKAGPETLSKTITVSRFKNNRHPVVRSVQKYLNDLGFHCGNVDGIAGIQFDSAVRAYQKANNCIVDGVITAGKNTWKSLLGLR